MEKAIQVDSFLMTEEIKYIVQKMILVKSH